MRHPGSYCSASNRIPMVPRLSICISEPCNSLPRRANCAPQAPGIIPHQHGEVLYRKRGHTIPIVPIWLPVSPPGLFTHWVPTYSRSHLMKLSKGFSEAIPTSIPAQVPGLIWANAVSIFRNYTLHSAVMPSRWQALPDSTISFAPGGSSADSISRSNRFWASNG